MWFRKNFEELIFSARGQILKKRFSQNVSFYILNKTSVVDFQIFAYTIFEKLIKNDYFNYFYKIFWAKISNSATEVLLSI